MAPVPYEKPVAPPAKEVEVIPPVSELVDDVAARLKLAQMVDRQGVLGETIRPLEKEKKALAEKIKIMTGKYQIGKAICGLWRINYYNAPRKYLDPAKLMAIPKEELVNGITLLHINACYSESATYTLRITREGEPDESEG